MSKKRLLVSAGVVTVVAGVVAAGYVTSFYWKEIEENAAEVIGYGIWIAGAITLAVGVVLLAQQEQSSWECGACLKCGYPTQGLDSPSCPECGEVLSRADINQRRHAAGVLAIICASILLLIAAAEYVVRFFYGMSNAFG